jgi:phosphoglycolate phosphatase-like HAD superfamily hydrolase
VRAAIDRAKTQYGESGFERIVSVGDAMWDVQTAWRLALPFVGVASGERAAMLRNNGARTTIEDFVNYQHCMECFERAAPPDDLALREASGPCKH